MGSRFLTNRLLWREILSRLEEGDRVDAAIAYLGSDGASLLPLPKDSRLVIDMSLSTVRQGATDPREIAKLVKRSVQVFSRRSLHAKFIVTDKWLLTGSANVSNNSRLRLDEAAILTDDPAAIRRAKSFFEELCVEPVRRAYLQKCIKAYRPPVFTAAVEPTSRSRPISRATAKLWFIGGLSEQALSPADERLVVRRRGRLRRQMRNPTGHELDWIRYPRKPQFFDRIRNGDWVVSCMADSTGRKSVYAPSQVITKEHWMSSQRKRYAMLWLEAAPSGESMSWAKFRQRVRRVFPKLDRPNARSRPIPETERADAILRIWKPSGKLA